MSINMRFGNLTAKQFEEKTGAELSAEDRDWIEQHRIDKADFKENDKLHIFDMPLGIVAGSEIGRELVGRLRGYEFAKCHFYVETKDPED